MGNGLIWAASHGALSSSWSFYGRNILRGDHRLGQRRLGSTSRPSRSWTATPTLRTPAAKLAADRVAAVDADLLALGRAHGRRRVLPTQLSSGAKPQVKPPSASWRKSTAPAVHDVERAPRQLGKLPANGRFQRPLCASPRSEQWGDTYTAATRPVPIRQCRSWRSTRTGSIRRSLSRPQQ